MWDDAALEGVVASDGFLERLGPGGVHLSMSTVSPETARRLAALHARHGGAYVAAPIFGRPEAAVARRLWVPISGLQAAKERARPLLTAMGGQGIFDIGEDVGAANIVKLVGNFLIVSAAYSMREALAMADREGVDPTVVVDMLTQTLFNAPIYRSYGAMIAAGTAPFGQIGQSGIGLKDTGLFRDTAHRVGAPTPMADRLYDLLEGIGEWATPPALPAP